MAQNGGQARVILWSVPRSCTTAFAKAMSNIEGSVVYYEPFNSAVCLGPERAIVSVVEGDRQSWTDLAGANLAYDSSVNTFAWVKERLEAEHADATLVFAKDFPYGFESRKWKFLPSGFCHTFLIRNPNKVVVSWRKCNEEYRPGGHPVDEQSMEAWHDVQMGRDAGFKALADLYQHVKENIHPNPFVMDADDLIAEPEAVMTAYCKATGIPFSRKLLHWEDNGLPMNVKWITCRDELPFFKAKYHANAQTSRGFVKGVDLMHPPTSTPPTNPKVVEVIERCMPYYKQLYQQRFIPQMSSEILKQQTEHPDLTQFLVP